MCCKFLWNYIFSIFYFDEPFVSTLANLSILASTFVNYVFLLSISIIPTIFPLNFIIEGIIWFNLWEIWISIINPLINPSFSIESLLSNVVNLNLWMFFYLIFHFIERFMKHPLNSHVWICNWHKSMIDLMWIPMNLFLLITT